MFADVRFVVNDFRTSPAPSAISMAGFGGRVQETEITGIPANLRADALFFLHTWNSNPNRDVTLFGYRVHYDDGASVDIPVAIRRDIGFWQMETPVSYQNAAVAWAGPAPAGQALRPVLYMMQWDNPYPEKIIASVDLWRAEDGRHGAPAVLAITAAVKE